MYAIALLHNIVAASIETSANSMQAAIFNLMRESSYIVICQLPLRPGWRRHVCPDYIISPGVDANRRFLQVPSAIILRIRLGSAVSKTIVLASQYFSMEIFFGIQFINHHVNYIFSDATCVESTTNAILL